MRLYPLIVLLAFSCFSSMSQPNEPTNKPPAEVMRELRIKMLTIPATELGQHPTPEYPHVCRVLMDWPLDGVTVSVVALSTGDASIYTTGTFGVMGGIGHETVRNAAKTFVKVAGKYFDDASPTKDYPYPKASRVRFYFVCYDGIRVIDDDLTALRNGTAKCSDLYKEGQNVITELRTITQKQKGEAH